MSGRPGWAGWGPGPGRAAVQPVQDPDDAVPEHPAGPNWWSWKDGSEDDVDTDSSSTSCCGRCACPGSNPGPFPGCRTRGSHLEAGRGAGCSCPCWRNRWRRRKRRWRRPRLRVDQPGPRCSANSACELLGVLVIVLRWVGATRLPSPSLSCSGRSGSARPLFWIALVLLLSGGVAGNDVSPETDVIISNNSQVCGSLDIRNNVQAFSALKDCTVVEGFLQIVLIDQATTADFMNLSFPDLKEITGYLFLYRVSGLVSLAKLFPNLAVIRGQKLLFNYALTIYEMPNMHEIGLISLLSILRGSVRIEKNPVLCYVETIDWEAITDGAEHVIKGNKPVDECPRKCPRGCPSMPVKPHTAKHLPNLCWTSEHCQRICPAECPRSCSNSTTCCHSNCLGGCEKGFPQKCVVCRGVQLNNRCVGECPATMYKYLDRRCVREDQCREMPAPKEYLNEIELPEKIFKSFPWKPWNGTCSLDCPPGYKEKRSNRSKTLYTYDCEKCDGPCARECAGGMIDNISKSQKMRGCTYVKNSLEIQIRGGKNIVKELEENLQSIESIRGYLKIVRSFPLVSLNFLKNLRVIHGEMLEAGKYALVVLDNQNLQKLWTWGPNDTLVIEKGRIFFHFNPKLCMKEIDELRNKTKIAKNDQDVDTNSNGDKVPCNMVKMSPKVYSKSNKAVLVRWKSFSTPDPRTLLGYVVFHIEAPYKNITLFDGRDACGGDGWDVNDVGPDPNPSPKNESESEVTHIFTHLKPYTQYAYYVKTYSVATSGSGGQSDIAYFRTLPDEPSVPQLLFANPVSSSELFIRWQPPLHPNGKITQYIVRGSWEQESEDFVSKRNYCEDPLVSLGVDQSPKPTEIPQEETKNKEDKDKDSEDCSCSSTGLKKPEDKLDEIQFEDGIHNLIYIRRSDDDQQRHKRWLNPYNITDEQLSRYRRAIDSGQGAKFPNQAFSDHPTSSDPFKEVVKDGIYHSFQRVLDGTELKVPNLHHYARYSIKVIACRERDPDEALYKLYYKNCSSEALYYARTLQNDTADNIVRAWVDRENGTSGDFYLRWIPPPNPNGHIVKYDIHILSEDVENSTPRPFCLRYSKTLTSFKLSNLKMASGNYSVRISATSLYKQGNFTEKMFFIIEAQTTVSLQTVVLAVVGVVVLLVAAAIIGYYARRRWCASQVPPMKLITIINPDYISAAAYVPDEWEVPRENIELLRELGQGSFGMVYEGILRNGGGDQPCAIKTVNEHATDRERIEFLNEASVMKAFKTHHVVRLLGVVSSGQPTMVIMELMAKQDLKSYLRKHRPDESDDPSVQPPTLKQILRMAMEIADGMAYLSAKKFVHRDLAARNCMVAEDMTVKIGDFGMTRDIYETEYYRKGSKGLMPVRWMAPESLKDGVFTSCSDVWSYGVVLWEMATLASQPYQGLSNEQVLHYVMQGGVMEAPEKCPERLYELMRLCWQFKPLARPSFLTFVEMLLPDVEPGPSFNARSFFYSPEAHEVRQPQASGMAPLEEGELDPDMDGDGVSPETPLRTMHDIENFSVDGSDSDGEHQVNKIGGPAPALSSYAQYHKTYSSDSSRESKASNGSSANAATANGYIVSRHGNGATGHSTHASHRGATLKTTEC